MIYKILPLLLFVAFYGCDRNAITEEQEEACPPNSFKPDCVSIYDFDTLTYSNCNFFAKDFGPTMSNILVKMSAIEVLNNDTFLLDISSTLDYTIKLKSNRINDIDSTRTLDYYDYGKLVFSQSEPYLDERGSLYVLSHDIKYHFESEVDGVESAEITRTFGCDQIVLKYTRAINPLDSISAIFVSW